MASWITCLGGWNFLTIQSVRSGLPETFTMAGSPFKYLPGETQPNLVSGQSINVPNYSIGPNLWPQNLQNSVLQHQRVLLPGGVHGRQRRRRNRADRPRVVAAISISKTIAYREQYKMTVRMDANNLPKTRWLQSPNTTVNITSPQTFGKFAPADRHELLAPGTRRARTSSGYFGSSFERL